MSERANCLRCVGAARAAPLERVGSMAGRDVAFNEPLRPHGLAHRSISITVLRCHHGRSGHSEQDSDPRKWAGVFSIPGFYASLTKQKIPIWCKLDKEGAAKFPDSVWKMLLYTLTFVWATYLVFFGEDQLFFDLRSHFNSE